MSEKNRDNKNRWRNVTIAFRMSPEENETVHNQSVLFSSLHSFLIKVARFPIL